MKKIVCLSFQPSYELEYSLGFINLSLTVSIESFPSKKNSDNYFAFFGGKGATKKRWQHCLSNDISDNAVLEQGSRHTSQ